MLYSSYKETQSEALLLKEGVERTKPPFTPAKSTPYIFTPNNPTPVVSSFKSTDKARGCNSLISPLPEFGQSEMDRYLRAEIERDAIEEIQRHCSHKETRQGCMRILGDWYVGDICDNCDKMINPFPDRSHIVLDAYEAEDENADNILFRQTLKKMSQAIMHGS
jgi:hypothetical protein